MQERLVLPPEIVNVEGWVIFLGGPIQGAPIWQPEAADKIHKLNSEICVASTRQDYGEGEFVYEKQVDWETHFLRRAAGHGAVMFWLAKQTQETEPPHTS